MSVVETWVSRANVLSAFERDYGWPARRTQTLIYLYLDLAPVLIARIGTSPNAETGPRTEIGDLRNWRLVRALAEKGRRDLRTLRDAEALKQFQEQLDRNDRILVALETEAAKEIRGRDSQESDETATLVSYLESLQTSPFGAPSLKEGPDPSEMHSPKRVQKLLEDGVQRAASMIRHIVIPNMPVSARVELSSWQEELQSSV